MTALAQLMCPVHHRGKLSLSMKYFDTSGTMELEGNISYITSPVVGPRHSKGPSFATP